ncbi:hypothetical protein AB0M45_05265 [Nocardia sp. NPDC051787]|uniref:hypothetical protein n=1 Tax=Nocardia sp. NPDC051787 TaxID=3155415 RepID=UPI00343DD347
MKSYNAAFSASFHTPWQNADRSTHGATVPPSAYFLYGSGNGAEGVQYDRYAWAADQGKPWLGDQPLDSGSLFDLLGGISIFTPNNPRGLDGTKPLDAALCFEGASKVYLFQGESCYRVSIAKPTAQELDTDTQSRTIKSVFGYDFDEGGGKEFPFGSVDATLYSPTDRRIWFFHDSDCESVDYLEFKPDHWDPSAGGTVPSIRSAWPDIPSEFTDKVTWAATVISSDDGTYQDRGYLSNGTAVGAVIPSTRKPANYTVIFTEPGEHLFSVPANVSRITIELWGPGGAGGASGSGYGAATNGGNGGAGAYIKHVTTSALSCPTTVHVGGQGDYTCYPAQNPTLVAGGGGGGGGGGGCGAYDSYGGDGGNGGGGNGGDGHGGNLGGSGGSGGVGSSGDGSGAEGSGSEGGDGGSRGGGGGGGYEDGGGGGGGGGGHGYQGEGAGGGGGDARAGGGGGAQGPSHYPTNAVFKPCADGDPRTPYTPLNTSAGFGGSGGDAWDGGKPGGDGAARISVEIS